MKQRTMWTVVAAMALTMSAAAAEPSGDADWPDQAYFSARESYMRVNLQTMEKRYLDCLACDNTGVVESALAHIALMKLYRPEADLPALQARVRALAVSGCTPAVRYKAQLVSLLYDHPSVCAAGTRVAYSTSEEMFTALALRMRETLLTSGDTSDGAIK